MTATGKRQLDSGENLPVPPSPLPRRPRLCDSEQGRSQGNARPQKCRKAHPWPRPRAPPLFGTPIERRGKKFLKNQDWIDEEEADLILAIREEKEHGLRGENIRDFALRYGRDLKD